MQQFSVATLFASTLMSTTFIGCINVWQNERSQTTHDSLENTQQDINFLAHRMEWRMNRRGSSTSSWRSSNFPSKRFMRHSILWAKEFISCCILSRELRVVLELSFCHKLMQPIKVVDMSVDALVLQH